MTMLQKNDRLLKFQTLLENPVPASKWLLALNLAFWIFAFVSGLVLIENYGFVDLAPTPDQLVFTTGLKFQHLIDRGQWWRLFTSMWVHLGILHLAFNAFGLYIIAPLIEKFYDTRRLLVIYLGSGLIGSLASYYFVAAPSGGASGALYGLIGATIVFGFRYRKELPSELGKKLSIGMLPWVVFNIAIGFFDAVPFDNGAHIGGFLGGIFLTFLISARLEIRSKARNSIFLLLAIGLTSLNFLALIYWGFEITQCLSHPDAFQACYAMPF